MVITVTGVAERVSPRFAGVLLGFPLGVGLSLFFIGIEQGPEFAASSSLWSIQGLVASLFFCAGYRGAVKFFPWTSRWAVLPPIVIGIVLFFGASLVLQQLSLSTLFARFCVVVFALITASVLFRMGLMEQTVTRIRVTWRMLCIRALSAAVVVVCITETAELVGPQWSGLFSAFPVTILPVAALLHFHYGSTAVLPLFKELPQGMVAIIVFSLAVYTTFPAIGVVPGSCVAYLVAGCYLLFYELVLRRRVNVTLDRVIRAVSKN